MDWINRSKDLLFLLALVTLVIVLSYATLHAFILPYSPNGSEWWAHGLAVTIDGMWVYSLAFLVRGLAPNRKSRIIARTLLWGALSVSLVSAAFFGYTTLGIVAAFLYIIPALSVLGLELLLTSTYLGAPAVQVTRSFTGTGTANGSPTKDVPNDLVDIANEIVEKVKSGDRRPGWNRIATTYNLRQGEAKRTLELVKNAVGEAA